MAETTPTAEPTRRDFLFIATGATAAIGVAAVAWPFVAQLAPDAEVIAAGAPIEVDLSPIAEGQIVRVFWRDALIFVRHRTAEENRGGARDAAIRSHRSGARCRSRGRGAGAVADHLRATAPISAVCLWISRVSIAGWFCPVPWFRLRYVRARPRRPGADQFCRFRPTNSSMIRRSSSAKRPDGFASDGPYGGHASTSRRDR